MIHIVGFLLCMGALAAAGAPISIALTWSLVALWIVPSAITVVFGTRNR